LKIKGRKFGRKEREKGEGDLKIEEEMTGEFCGENDGGEGKWMV
jgi:hypothetical protein